MNNNSKSCMMGILLLIQAALIIIKSPQEPIFELDMSFVLLSDHYTIRPTGTQIEITFADSVKRKENAYQSTIRMVRNYCFNVLIIYRRVQWRMFAITIFTVRTFCILSGNDYNVIYPAMKTH